MTEIPLKKRSYDLFQDALERPAGERRSYVEARAGGDNALLAETERLLGAYSEESSGLPQAVLLNCAPEDPGRRLHSLVDDWEIQELLGEGGYGTVYRACRTVSGRKEDVAIKFLRTADSGAVDRFKQERQLMADFGHEGIARFRGGGSQGGSLYVIMDYVPGDSITEYCRSKCLDLKPRLDLFVRLCKIVEYAHDRRVLHRDIKPPNIRVTPENEVRLLDLGIAKVISPPAGKVLTETLAPLFSKEYASPEQVRHKDLSFATDVYALGVLLYELLSGRRPFSFAALNAPGWEQVICQRVPARPSDAVMLEDPDTGAPSDPGAARRMKRQLTGDLDSILMRAIEKEPRRRYQRVDRLRLDIERYLDGLAVEARPCGLRERIAKWCAHNPFSAAALAASGLCTFGFLNFSTLQFIGLETQLKNEKIAVERLQYVAGAALPQLEQAVDILPDSGESRQTLVRIHADLLGRLDSLPLLASADVDRILLSSAEQCAREWQRLNEPARALKLLNPAVERAKVRYDWSQNRQEGVRGWMNVFLGLLRLRIEVAGALQQDTSGDARSVAALERGSQ